MSAKKCPLTNRELSWLDFNQRVQAEANDPATPLLERLFFLSIVSSNLDEFFMVRVGGLHLQNDAGITRTDPSGLSPAEVLGRVRLRVRRQIEDQYLCLAQHILPGLAAHQVVLTAGSLPSPEELRLLEPVFTSQIFPVLTPVALTDDTAFPLLAPLSNYLAVQLAPAAAAPQARRMVLVRLGPDLPRVWRVPGVTGEKRRFVLLEDLVRVFLPRLLPGQVIEEARVFRVTRNADIPLNEEFATDLATAMTQLLRERRIGPCVRLELEQSASKDLTTWLSAQLTVADDDIFRIDGPLDLTGLRELRTQTMDQVLCYPTWTPQPNPLVDTTRNIFEQMAQQDILLATPYESFDPVLRLVESAAIDPQVRAIKIVLYRTSTKGPLVRALSAAARSGKHVTTLIELKARFDEARNIDWARGLEEAGVQVVYGVRNLKTHAKICLVIRREDANIRYYMHFGTGNYNENTAKLYTDVGLLTCDQTLGRDAAMFFHAVTGFSEPQPYQKLVQAPTGLRDRLLELIRFEADQAKNRQPAQIIAKMNALVDPELIAALYDAAHLGVEIRLCVRGICCLRPGIAGVSENITVTSVVDRFLEHSRIFYFQHGGQEELFISSADWMPRNLDRRIELLVPVQDPACRRRLREILHSSLADNVKAWHLQPNGTYTRALQPQGQHTCRSQSELCESATSSARQARKAARTIFEPHLPACRP